MKEKDSTVQYLKLFVPTLIAETQANKNDFARGYRFALKTVMQTIHEQEQKKHED